MTILVRQLVLLIAADQVLRNLLGLEIGWLGVIFGPLHKASSLAQANGESSGRGWYDLLGFLVHDVVVADRAEDSLESFASELVGRHFGQGILWNNEHLGLVVRTDGDCDSRW